MTGVHFASRVLLLVPLLLSLGVHEWAHAYAALRLGDATAEEQGRLTLNPFAHVDVIGSLLPLLGIPFGWAKPVPVDPTRFRDDVPMARGMLLTAAAGPASNVALAALCAAAIAAIARGAPAIWAAQPALAFLLTETLVINVTLAAFNLLPVPPLDGGRIAEAFVPFEWRGAWDAVSTYGMSIVIALLVIPGFFGVSPFGWAAAIPELLVRR